MQTEALRKWTKAVVTAALVSAMAVAAPGSAVADGDDGDSRCTRVRGAIDAVFVADGCRSPVGLCTRGTVRGGGRLHGGTAFTTLAMAPSAGMPLLEAPTELSYSGELVISTRRGDLWVRDLGVFSATRGKFTEMARVAGGTGRFEGAYGTFFIFGDVKPDGSGFDSVMHGEFCTP